MPVAGRKKDKFASRLAILGGGNIGRAMANGLVKTGSFQPTDIYITRRRIDLLDSYKKRGFKISDDNAEAVAKCRRVIIAVQPGQLVALLDSIRPALLPARHLLFSSVTGVTTDEIRQNLGNGMAVVRIMPNTAITIGQSMTCLAANGRRGNALKAAQKLFDKVGQTLIIDEDQMTPATALCGCGIAFFLRSIRAASQGGIQIGFHADEALRMAAQTAKGAASLLLESKRHPESEIDRVTTPRGCTIAGLNRMEHEGFSSAMIKGLVKATEVASSLFTEKK